LKKAFDTVRRDALWSKLLINIINGKMYNVIYNMYQNSKSRIVYNGKVSNYFDCNNVIRQRENLPPFLFSLYLNDLENKLDKNNAIGLISLTEDLQQELDTYLKLSILLYADDIAILAESSDDMQNDMQNQINYSYDFCKKWRLKVNIEKSKVLFFFEWSPTK
jgi:hypothetical protein